MPTIEIGDRAAIYDRDGGSGWGCLRSRRFTLF
jgi:hypothetical protein